MHRKLSKQLCAGIMLVLCAPGAPAAGEWTLDAAITAAVSSSEAAHIAHLEAGEATLDARDARARRYPQLSLGAEASVVSEVMEIEMPLRTVRFGDYDSYDLSVAITQVLYDGGRLRALARAGEARATMSESAAAADELIAELEAKAAFFGVLLAERQHEAAIQARTEAQNHFEDIDVLHDQGMALANDVTRARLRVAAAELTVRERASALERSRAAFRRVTDLSPDEPVTLVWDDVYEPLFDSIDSSILNQSRPEFRAFDAASEAARHTADAARAGYKPVIGLSAGMHYGRPGLDMPANEWMHYTSGGIRLDWDIWNWGETDRAIARADIAARKVDENRREFAREIAWRLADAEAAWHDARDRRDLAHETLTYAESNLTVITAQSQAGTATETDYDNAHAAFAKARMDAAAADVAVWLAAAQVEYVLGIRSEGESHE